MAETNAFAQRFAILISHERSGSHYLADMLTATSKFRSFDEVCNFDAIDPDTAEASFFRFRREAQLSDPDIVLRPSIESITRLMDRYLRHLAKLAKPKKRILLDIKYGHVHNFEVGWWPSERRPFLLAYLEQKGIKVIHLTRRDSLAAAVSGHIADQTRVWHKKDGEHEQGMPRIRLAVMEIAHDALALEREKDNFFAWLATNDRFDLEYEQLSGLPAARHAVMTQLCAFLGLSAPEEFRSSYRKVTPPLRDVVENYDELVEVARLFDSGRLKIETV